MNYRSISDLNDDVRELAYDLPNDIDLIVGIPRSGMLVGNLLALHLNLPLTDVDGLCENRILQSGKRHKHPEWSTINNILVIDDSVCHGTQMRQTQSRVDSANLQFNIEYAAVYITPKGNQYVDYWSEVVDLPRYFEWNIMHHDKISQMCVDIDGVLCRDPTPEENDDGENYLNFLQSVNPKTIPTKKIGWLVTSRLEKYRTETKDWLDSHDVKYDKLIMMDHPDKETREMEGDHAEFKANVYASVDAELFIESSIHQSKEIAERVGKPVFCYDTNTMIYPDSISAMKQQLKHSSTKSEEYLQRFSNNPKRFVQEAVGHVKGRLGDVKHRLRLMRYNIKKK